MTAAPTVSVVMPTYRRAHGLTDVLAPLLDDPGALEVIVVVDGSPDGSLGLLQTIAAEHPRLRPLWQENAGEMAAREAGVEAARGDVVLLLDDDVLAGPRLAAGHAARHAAAPRLVVVGAMPVRLPPRRDARNFAAFLYAREYAAACERYGADPDAVLRHLWAGNVSLRRADALAVGLPSPGFAERYHPDRELGLRLRAHGLCGLFAPELRAEHLYERPLDAFLRDARSQGRATVALHHLHGDQLGPLDAGQFAADLPAPVGGVMALGRRPRARRPLEAALRAAAVASGRVGALRAQELSARLARRVQQQSGALGAAAEPA